MIHNYFTNQGKICGWCDTNQVEGNSVYCATCEHEFKFTDDFSIDECNELGYNERLAAGFAHLQASESPYPYQRYWS